jgi:hypothetical protein
MTYANIKTYLDGVNLCEVVTRSKTCDFGRSLAGVVGSSPASVMGVCLLRLCVVKYRSLC